MVIPQDGAVPDLPSGYPFPPFVMGLHKVDCQPWYPRLNQTQGPSLGITFGTGSEKINRLQIFKSNDICVSDWNENKNTASCCEAKNGGLLGTIHENGKGDFGADYDLGPEGGACVRLGPGFDQTLWQMRYYKAT